MLFTKNKMLYSSVFVLNTPMSVSLSYLWNLGSMLGVVLMNQLVTGLLLVIFYTGDTTLAFSSVEYIMLETNSGWFLRLVHLNGASLLLGVMLAHVGRGFIYMSFRLWKAWSSGVLLLVLVMGEALMGYVLPWGQMSVWGACVITSLLSVVPLVGEEVVVWVWGGLVVNSATLGCLFMFHLVLPLVILVVVMMHVMFLHESGSSSSCGGSDSELKVKLFPYFVQKDMMNIVIFGSLVLLCCLGPWVLGDCENLKEANLMSSPVHIQPEWYLLLAYAILRSVPNKLGGVMAFLFSIVGIWVLCFLPYSSQSNYMSISLLVLSVLSVSVVVLTLLGASVVEYPLITMSQVFTCVYLMSLICYWAFSLLCF